MQTRGADAREGSDGLFAEVDRALVAFCGRDAHREDMETDAQEQTTADVGGLVAIGVPPLLLTVPDAARALAIGRTMLCELIAERRLEVVHIGRCTRVPVDALRTFVEEQRVGR